MIAISSFNRASYKQDFSLAAFKESGAIEYSADVVLALKRAELGAELAILKNRNGSRDNVYDFTF